MQAKAMPYSILKEEQRNFIFNSKTCTLWFQVQTQRQMHTCVGHKDWHTVASCNCPSCVCLCHCSLIRGQACKWLHLAIYSTIHCKHILNPSLVRVLLKEKIFLKPDHNPKSKFETPSMFGLWIYHNISHSTWHVVTLNENGTEVSLHR